MILCNEFTIIFIFIMQLLEGTKTVKTVHLLDNIGLYQLN